MSEPTTRASRPAGWRGVAVRAGLAGLRASLKVSPWPTVWVLRRVFAATGRRVAASLRARAPADVSAVLDERYGDHPDERLDVYHPGATAVDGHARRWPTVVWAHGGAFVGGSKDEIGSYLRMIAAAGFTVVGVNYSLAPGATYPTPVRQVMAALRHVEADASRLHADPGRLVLAGDSAGAHITTQVAAIATNPGYGKRVGVEPTITPDQLRGVALCCGAFDVALIDPDRPFDSFVRAVGWAYSGSRDYRSNDHFLRTVNVTEHVTEAFPPAFLTAGNADPLEAHSHVLAAVLESKSVDVETLFYPADHVPPLPHEYQFDLTLDDARVALDRLLAFVRRCTQ